MKMGGGDASAVISVPSMRNINGDQGYVTACKSIQCVSLPNSKGSAIKKIIGQKGASIKSMKRKMS